MAFALSPGVTISEIDLTTVIPAVSTTNGAFVGRFQWGPADKIMLIDSEIRLVDTFGEPDQNTYTSFFSAANFLAYGNNLRVVRSVANTAYNATANGSPTIQIKNSDVWQLNYYNSEGQALNGEWAAKYPGVIGNSLYVATCPSANAWAMNISSAISNVNASTYTVNTTINFSQNVIALGGVAVGDLIALNGNTTYIKLTSLNSSGLTGNLAVASSNIAAGPVSKKWGWANYFQGAPNTSPYVAQKAGSKDEMHVIVVDTLGYFPPDHGSANNVVLEVFPYVSKAIDAINQDGSTNYVRDVIATKSKYVHWLGNPTEGTNWGSSSSNTAFTDVKNARYSQLSGGASGLPTDGNIATSWDMFANPEEVDISLVVTGNSSTTIDAYVINNIVEARKDCIAFISPLFGDVVNQSGSEVTNILSTLDTIGVTSSYAVVDSGWKYQFDKYNNTYRWVPLNADIAGLCVRTDAVRDPWFSPAGFNRGQLKNVTKLAWNPTQAERDSLYVRGVNPVVQFPGQGTVLYGDKTLQSKPSAFDRINVRRLFIVLEKAIAIASKYSLFEFNDEFTRASFVNMVEPFLRDVQGRRGIYDFRVVCDETNNTPEVIDGNRFIGDIYIKPARSVNYIQLNFVAVRTGVEFSEVVGRF